MISHFTKRFFSTTTTAMKKVTIQKLNNDLTGVTLFELDNPKTKNAISWDLINDFREAVKLTNEDENCRAVIVKSKTPGMFCSGADLKERLNITNFQTDLLVATLRNTFNELYVMNLPVPTIACIDGHALGGGLELALCCDFRIATKNVAFGLPETSWGWLPGAGGTQTLSRIVGIAKAKEIILLGKKLNSQEALEYNLVNYVENDYEAAYNKCLEIAKQILPKGPLGIRAAKQAVNASIEVDLKTGLDIERMLYSRIIETEDRIEGLKAFTEKRKPVFKGK